MPKPRSNKGNAHVYLRKYPPKVPSQLLTRIQLEILIQLVCVVISAILGHNLHQNRTGESTISHFEHVEFPQRVLQPGLSEGGF